MRRFHLVARNGISDFRAALGEVYAGEIEEFERGRMALTRVLRFIGRQSKAIAIVTWRHSATRRRAAAAQASAPEAAAVPNAAAVPEAGVAKTGGEEAKAADPADASA